MKRKTILRYHSIYLLIVILSILAVSFFSLNALKTAMYKHTAKELKETALIIKNMLLPGGLEDLRNIDLFCKNAGKDCEIRITIILPDGTVAGDSVKDTAVLNNHADREEIREAFSGKEGSSLRYSVSTGQEMMYLAVPCYKNSSISFILRTSMPVTIMNEALTSDYFKTIIAGIFAILLTTGVSIYVSGKIKRPLSELKKAASEYSSGNFKFKFTIEEPEEIKILADAMDNMAAQITTRIDLITSQKNELEAVLSGMGEAVIVLNPQMIIINLNAAALKLINKTPEEVKEKSLIEIFRNSDIINFTEKTLRSGMPLEEDIFIYGNRDLFLQAHGTVLYSGSTGFPERIILVLNDITRLKILENIRKDFVANVSHELKTPVTSIMGFIETLLEGNTNDKETTKRFLNIILKQSKRLNAIIEDLLSLSRLEQQEDAIEIEICDLKEILSNSVNMYKDRANRKEISLKLICQDSLSVRINNVLMEQAIANLIDNAIKYSNPESTIEINVVHRENNIEISVTDSGCGIPEKDIPRIFERFYRVDKARSREMGGTGLGLAIVKHIALSFNGQVKVQSSLNKGSTFTIILPKAD